MYNTINTLGRFGGRPAPNGFLFFKQKRFIESKRNLLHCVPDKISDKFMERNIYRVIFLRSVNVQNPPGAARPPFRWMKVKSLHFALYTLTSQKLVCTPSYCFVHRTTVQTTADGIDRCQTPRESYVGDATCPGEPVPRHISSLS